MTKKLKKRKLDKEYEAALKKYSDIVQDRSVSDNEQEELNKLLKKLIMAGPDGQWRAEVLYAASTRIDGEAYYPHYEGYFDDWGNWNYWESMMEGPLPQSLNKLVEELPESNYFFLFIYEPRRYQDFSSLSSMIRSLLETENYWFNSLLSQEWSYSSSLELYTAFWRKY